MNKASHPHDDDPGSLMRRVKEMEARYGQKKKTVLTEGAPDPETPPIGQPRLSENKRAIRQATFKATREGTLTDKEDD